MSIAGADNCPPMLEKSMYDSWKSRMELYIENKENKRMILNSVLNGPLLMKRMVPLGQRSMKNFQLQRNSKLTVILKLPTSFFKVFHRMCMPSLIIIKLPKRYGIGLSFLCMKLSLQEKECKLHDEFDKFSFMKGETLYQY
ncbi:hypothetical protein Tco_1424698 [Tanacetum coccineum]